MPKTQLIGKISPFTGNLLFEILNNLKNYGLGRVVVRNSYKKQYPEMCYYVIRKVIPLRETIGKGPDELVYGNVWADEVFRGRKMEGLRLLQEATFLPDWQLISREEEDKYLNCETKVVLKILPKEDTFPPVLAQLMKQKNPHLKGEPKMDLVYDYPKDNFRVKFNLPEHQDYKVAEEGEEPNYKLKVKIPEKFKVGIKS